MSNIKNISAENCYRTIKENKDAYLVDVRTPYEWETFGRVDKDSFDAQYIELTLINEEGDENTNFLHQFNSYGISKNSEIKKHYQYVFTHDISCMIIIIVFI